eukprot:COSAG01_NODE_330_length_18723_cov_96.763155_13_plen_191_part_00
MFDEIPVSKLKGCGKMTIQKLNANGIYTCRDLIEFEGSIPKLNVESLKKKAQQQNNNQNICIDSHNWKDRVCHITTKKNHVVRAKIGNLIIGKHFTALEVGWKTKCKTEKCKKLVTPSAVLCTHILWITNDIMSDDSDEESEETVTSVLPKILVDTRCEAVKNLNPNQKKALHSVIKETNQLYACVLPSE